jgi:hypothetical protein
LGFTTQWWFNWLNNKWKLNLSDKQIAQLHHEFMNSKLIRKYFNNTTTCKLKPSEGYVREVITNFLNKFNISINKDFNDAFEDAYYGEYSAEHRSVCNDKIKAAKSQDLHWELLYSTYDPVKFPKVNCGHRRRKLMSCFMLILQIFRY